MSIVVVCGPPCGGKSTYVEARRAEGDRVVDYDDILEAISGVRFRGTSEQKSQAAELWLQRATVPEPEGTTWVIWANPGQAQRDRWREHYGATFVVVKAPMDRCLERAAQERPLAWQDLIHDWFATWQPSQTAPERVVVDA